MDQEQQQAVADLDRDLDALELSAAVEIRDGEMVISGLVDSREDRQAILDVAEPYARELGLRLNDGLEVEVFGPEDAVDDEDTTNPPGFGDLDVTGIEPSVGDAERVPSDIVNGYVDKDENIEPLDDDFAADPGTTDVIGVVQEEETFFAPTDPPTGRTLDNGGFEVLNGFADSAEDDATTPDPNEPESDTNRLPTEDELADIVRRELRDDSLTTDLPVHVTARGSVVTLRGTVDTLEDAENAEAVANRVPSVGEVREELKIRGVMERDE